MFTGKMQRLPVTDEAKVFYLSNCLMQGDYIEAQRNNGIDPPKIRVDYEYAKVKNGTQTFILEYSISRL